MRLLVAVLLLFVAACGVIGKPDFRPAAEPAPTAAPVPSPTAKRPPDAPARPAWRPRAVIADAVDVAAQVVTVSAGDTLSQIGERTGSSVQAIAAANGIAPPYVISVGQVLNVPAGRYHTVKAGETGIAIARAYGADWDRLVANNGLTTPYVLRVGQRLRLPTVEEVKAMTPAERAAAFTIDIDDLISGAEPASAAVVPAAPVAAAPSVPLTPTPPAPGQAAGTAVAATPPRTGYESPLPPPPAFDGRFAAPLAGRLISRFGAKSGGLYNDGVNIAAKSGTPIRAAADGVVAYAGDSIEGFGYLVLVRHGDGWVTAYAHAEELLVIRGDKVRQGDPIARVGKTGSVDAPQLHFELRQGRKPVDPAKHIDFS
jgi:murein DD-endopeptidase MepM/ murein hydrolase activator NlpD